MNKKTEKITIRLTLEEKQKIQQNGKKKGLALSKFCRMQILNRTIKTTIEVVVNSEILQAINKIGNNINQLTRAVNTGKITDADVVNELKISNKALNDIINQ